MRSSRARPIITAGYLVAAAALVAAMLTGTQVVLLGAITAAVLVLVRRGYWLAWIGVFLTPATGIRFGTSLVLPDLFLAPAIGLAAATFLTRRERPKVPSIVTAVAGLLVVASAIEVATTTVTPLSLAYAVRFALLVVGMPILFLVHGDTPERNRTLLAAFVLGAAGNGLLATIDARGVHIASRLTGFVGYLYNGGRYEGLSATTNQLGMVSVLALPILAYLAARHRVWWVAVLPLLTGILASGSRGAIVGVPVAALAWVVCRREDRVRALVWFGVAAGVGVLIAARLGLVVGLDRLLHGSDNTTVAISNAARLANASQALTDFTSHPLFGLGFGQPEAHDTYLELLRDGGMLLAAPLFVMLGWVAARCFRTHAAPAVAASVATWLILNVQFDGIYDRYLWVPFGAAVAAVARSQQGVVTPKHHGHRKHRHPRAAQRNLPARNRFTRRLEPVVRHGNQVQRKAGRYDHRYQRPHGRHPTSVTSRGTSAGNGRGVVPPSGLSRD